MAKLHLGELKITSPAFEHTGRIPDRHTVVGGDVSPTLSWSSVPPATAELALLCHDPDAPLTRGFVHWVLYGIPADASGVDEGGGGQFVQGRNGFGAEGYGGPAPPLGHGVHHYYFHLYALDAELNLPAGLTGEELLDRIDAHIIEQARIVGTFSR